MRIGRTAAALLISGLPAVAPAFAEEILDNPGYCDLPYEDREMAGIVSLTPTGIESHGARCSWADARFGPGESLSVRATCDDGASQWRTHLWISETKDGYVRVVPDGIFPLPGIYFPCSQWSRK